MKLYAINETEWVAAKTETEAIDYIGLEKEEVKSIEEIPEDEWDEVLEGYSYSQWDEETDDYSIITMTIKELMQIAIESGKPRLIVTENT